MLHTRQKGGPAGCGKGLGGLQKRAALWPVVLGDELLYMSYDYFNDLCSAKGNIAPAVILPHKAKKPQRKIDTAKKVYVVHHNTLSDTDSVISTDTGFGSDIIFQKQDRIG